MRLWRYAKRVRSPLPVEKAGQFLEKAPGKVGLYDPAYEHDACGVGFVAQIKGHRSHQILLDGQQMLCHMDHRGACGAEPNTGDGAGILTALPHEFLAKVAKLELDAELPDPGAFAAGLIFLPTRPDERARCKEETERIVAEQGQRVVGWRQVPVDPEEADLGPTSLAAAPAIEQLFIAAEGVAGDAFERQLYIIRKRASSLSARRPEPAAGGDVLHLQPLFQGDGLQGHALLGSALLLLSGSARQELHQPPGNGALPLQHQYLPLLGSSPAQPLHEPQRGDQHSTRQHELDACKTGGGLEPALRRAALIGLPHRRAGLLRLRHFRQRPRVPADDRPHAARSGDDDDPGGLAEPRGPFRREEGLLRISLLPDGALGRSRLHRLYRRPLHRRSARPQRSTPEPLRT